MYFIFLHCLLLNLLFVCLFCLSVLVELYVLFLTLSAMLEPESDSLYVHIYLASRADSDSGSDE